MNKCNPVLGSEDYFFTYKELVDLGIGSRSTIERLVQAGALKRYKVRRNDGKRIDLLSSATAMKTNDLKSSTYERVKRANRTYLSHQLKLGFNPKWYAVIHFEHDTTIKKAIQRRLDPIMVEEDV